MDSGAPLGHWGTEPGEWEHADASPRSPLHLSPLPSQELRWGPSRVERFLEMRLTENGSKGSGK